MNDWFVGRKAKEIYKQRHNSLEFTLGTQQFSNERGVYSPYPGVPWNQAPRILRNQPKGAC